jgi:glutamate racemase
MRHAQPWDEGREKGEQASIAREHLLEAWYGFFGASRCFCGEGDDATDVVALACTHYPLLLDRLIKLAPWPVSWLDPAPAIARRVAQLIGDAAAAQAQVRLEAAAFCTSGRMPPASLVEALARFGLRVKGYEEATAC